MNDLDTLELLLYRTKARVGHNPDLDILLDVLIQEINNLQKERKDDWEKEVPLSSS